MQHTEIQCQVCLPKTIWVSAVVAIKSIAGRAVEPIGIRRAGAGRRERIATTSSGVNRITNATGIGRVKEDAPFSWAFRFELVDVYEIDCSRCT